MKESKRLGLMVCDEVWPMLAFNCLPSRWSWTFGRMVALLAKKISCSWGRSEHLTFKLGAKFEEDPNDPKIQPVTKSLHWGYLNFRAPLIPFVSNFFLESSSFIDQTAVNGWFLSTTWWVYHPACNEERHGRCAPLISPADLGQIQSVVFSNLDMFDISFSFRFFPVFIIFCLKILRLSWKTPARVLVQRHHWWNRCMNTPTSCCSPMVLGHVLALGSRPKCILL